MKDKTNKAKIIKIIVVLCVAAAVLVPLYFWLRSTPLFLMFSDQQALQEYIARAGIWAPLVFFALQVLQVMVSPIPGNVTTLVGAALFGFWRGFLISCLAVTAGSVIAFLLARICGRPLAVKLVGRETVDKYLATLSSRSRILLVLMFLLPFFPDDALCLIAGLTGISIPHFLLLVLLTRPWGLLFSALLGSGAFSIPIWGWAIIVPACVAFFAAAAKYGPRVEEWLLSHIKKAGEAKKGQRQK